MQRKDTNRQMGEVTVKNRADSGIANPGRGVRFNVNPCSKKKKKEKKPFGKDDVFSKWLKYSAKPRHDLTKNI